VGQKILVVEDNELNLKLFCDLLRAHGYEAEPVRDGREAMERARAFRPDLIVMDIQMPHITGLELIEQLKADADLKAMPVMAVTAYAAKGDEERIRDAGAEGYVSKPISVMKFVEAVRALLVAQPEPVAPETAEPETAVSEAAEQVRVTRHFDAPAERVFDAWLDTTSLGEWLFATPDGEMVQVKADGQVGGVFTIVERRDDEDVLHTGRYEEVARPHRLVFTLQVPKYSDDESRIIVEIDGDSDGCDLILTQEGIGAEDQVAELERGWSIILESLAAVLDRSVT
jgi:two-component system, cell cycle response regulator DivK